MGDGLSGKLVFVILLMWFVHGSVWAGQCVRVARDCIEPGGERVVDGGRVYKDCWRYKDAYKCSGYGQNNCGEYKDSAFCMPTNSECSVNVGSWCVAQKHVYKCEEEEKYVRREKRVRYPTFTKSNDMERQGIKCNDAIRCVDGKCFDSSYEANDEMGNAVSMMSTLKEMQGDYQQYMSVFKGEAKECRRKSFGLNDCCRPDSGSFVRDIGLSSCDGDEKALMEKIKNNQCYFVGNYTTKMVFDLLRKHKVYVYCCFASRLAKEINEQGRRLISKSWGTPQNPDCSGFSLEELEGTDFSKIDFSFMGEEVNKSALWSKMGEMSKALEHTQILMEGEVNTIKNDVISSASNTEADIAESIDDAQLFEDKMNEVHNSLATQKKPIGRDKTRDLGGASEKDYNSGDVERDEEGLM